MVLSSDGGRFFIGFDATELAEREKGDPALVNFLSASYRQMEPRWRLIECLCGGTPAMRQAGAKYLPAEVEEEPLQWELRLSRSYLHEALNDTLDKIVAKPFAKSIVVHGFEDLDPRLQKMLENVDYQGTSATDFFSEVLRSASKYGHTHVLCEYPRVEGDRSLEQELNDNIRPYLVHIPARDLFGVKWKKVRGVPILTQIRFYERRTEETGKYGDANVLFFRVINAPANGQPGTWELWKEVEKEQPILVDSGTHTYPGIPIKTYYTKKTGFMTSLPPFEKLAWLSLMHWQSQSDQRNILRIARVGILFLRGIEEEESATGKKRKFVVGASNRVLRGPFESGAQWVEHSGKAIEAGRQDLLDIEHKMVLMGMEPFVEKQSDGSATGRAIRETHRVSQVQAWVRSLEAAIVDIIGIANVWINDSNPRAILDLPDSLQVDIYNEYFITMQAYEDMRLLLEAARSDKLTDNTLLSEFKRRGMLGESVDIGVEAKELEKLRKEKEEAAMKQKTMGMGVPRTFKRGKKTRTLSQKPG